MRVVGARLTVKIDGRIARIGIFRTTTVTVLSLKALHSCPGFDQRTVDAEVLIGQQIRVFRFCKYFIKNSSAISPSNKRSRFLLNTVGTQTSSSMFIPNKPAKQQIVGQHLHEQPLTTDGEENLESASSARNSFSGAIEGRLHGRVHLFELPIQPNQHAIDNQPPNRPERVVGGHALFRRQVAKHRGLLGVLACMCIKQLYLYMFYKTRIISGDFFSILLGANWATINNNNPAGMKTALGGASRIPSRFI